MQEDLRGAESLYAGLPGFESQHRDHSARVTGLCCFWRVAMDRYDPRITAEMMEAGARQMSTDPDAVWDEVIRDVFSQMMNVVLSRPELSTQYQRLLSGCCSRVQ